MIGEITLLLLLLLLTKTTAMPSEEDPKKGKRWVRVGNI